MVTPLGLDVASNWDALVTGRSGITRITRFDPSPYETQIAGEVHDFDPNVYMDRKEVRRTDRFTQLGVAIPQVREHIATFADYSKSTVDDVLGAAAVLNTLLLVVGAAALVLLRIVTFGSPPPLDSAAVPTRLADSSATPADLPAPTQPWRHLPDAPLPAAAVRTKLQKHQRWSK